SDEPLVVNRMGTDVHVQRAPKNKDALETLAMLEIENEEEDHSDFRETQNQNRIQYLRETINEVYSETNTVDDAEDISELEKRLRFKELNEKLDDKVTDVGLTEDQQKKLERKIDTGEWLDYGTPVAAFLSARVIEPLAGLVTGLGITALKKKFGSLDGDIEERFEKLTRQLEEEGYLTGDDLEGVGSSGEVTDQ
ncbi:transposase, partial [Halobiforma nitratireducens JCM 10879]